MSLREKASPRNFKPFFRSIPSSEEVPQFSETSLFEAGKLDVDKVYLDVLLRKRIRETIKSSYYKTVIRSAARYSDLGDQTRSSLESEKANRFIAHTKADVEEEKRWLLRYRGIVPERWKDTRNIWFTILEDIEKAGTYGVQLSKPLIDAALDHPQTPVVHKTIQYQRLDAEQLVTAFARPAKGVPNIGWAHYIAKSQTEKGVSENDIRKAYDKAQRQMRKALSKTKM